MTERILQFLLLAATLSLAPGITVAQTALKELPKEMVGIWGFDAADCRDEDSDGRVVVEPRQVSSFAAMFKLQTMSKLPNRTVRAATRRFDEGEARRPRDTLELKLAGPDSLVITSRDSGAVTYRRCKGGVRR